MYEHRLVRLTTVPLSLQKLIAGQMKFMGEHGFKVTMISSDFEGKSALSDSEQAEFIPVNMTRTISPFADLQSLYQLIKVFRKLKPQIVHTHTPKAGLLGMLASWFVKVPIRLHTVAGLPLMETSGVKRKILAIVERVTYSCATKVYPNSSNLKEFIIQQKFAKSDKLKVIGNGSSNGIDTNVFTRTEKIVQESKQIASLYNLKETDFVFVFVGRLVKDKGIEELVLAFDQLSVKYPDLKLLLVGPEEKELDPLSLKCLEIIHTNKAIITVGYQNDVKPYLALSKALVFPSYREGFPNVPMQAGCFDLPAIVTNINGCNEIIIEGENGLIIPTKESEALRNAMERLYLDQNLYRHMAEKARSMIVDRYEQEKVWDLILAEYQIHLKQKDVI
ncbi:glycosyltransferase family 4 protein [Pedobacter boryungensis]|uniref:Glycosyltransferase family 4 protein n=1 Tax=Pedobacter boryungensis TaxID=869962 RepID=A0ABX2DIH9_9SPHI|nr:glycosyltransferase family 4 protein [Pedobacter boryungensis]NQX32726.1 glycosyltransferase family 4 protein [Pedobacter boryungensis]